MRNQMCVLGLAVAMGGSLGSAVGCDRQPALSGNQQAAELANAGQAKPGIVAQGDVTPGTSITPQHQAKVAAKAEQLKPRLVEQVQVTPGKSITPQDQAKVASIVTRALVHIARAQQAIMANNVDGAKQDVAQAAALLAVLKGVLPTVMLIDRIQLAKTNLSYLNTTEVRQDLIAIVSAVDQVYEALPEGKEKGYAKQAKDALTNEKEKGALKAREALEAVEESMQFREIDLSVSHVSRWIDSARANLDQGKLKEAGEALNVAMDGVIYVDYYPVDPASVAARHIWVATQDWAGNNRKATKMRVQAAKVALQEVVRGGDKSRQDQAQHLIGLIDTLDVMKGGEQTGKALQELWQGARALDMNLPVPEKN